MISECESSGESSIRVPITLWDGDAFYEEDVVQMLINGLYYGLMLVMALYNAFVYFSIRERSYLVYVCFVVSAAIAQLAMSGLSYQFLWPTWPWWGASVLSWDLRSVLSSQASLRLNFYSSKVLSPRCQTTAGRCWVKHDSGRVASFFIPYGYAARGQLLLIMLAIPICVTGRCCLLACRLSGS